MCSNFLETGCVMGTQVKGPRVTWNDVCDILATVNALVGGPPKVHPSDTTTCIMAACDVILQDACALFDRGDSKALRHVTNIVNESVSVLCEWFVPVEYKW